MPLTRIERISDTPHLDLVKSHSMELVEYLSRTRIPFIDGENYSLACVVAVSRYQVSPELDKSPATVNRVRETADLVASFVAGAVNSPQSMYGTTTGFGGSGNNTRITNSVAKLQRVLIAGLQAGILPVTRDSPENFQEQRLFESLNESTLLFPEAWVRGAISIRLNSLIRGHSGCRYVIMEALLKLLAENITPCPPLRQSISASGDLGPLAYIAGALVGDPGCLVWEGVGVERVRTPAHIALARHSLETVSLLPKEGLAIVNGTAPSCSVASLVLHDAHILLLLSQATTAMCVEALLGTAESFDSFLSDIARPHPGQIEVSSNIRRALSGSRLVSQHDEVGPEKLRQDRYSLRTAPQWIGPHVEEMLSAHRTIMIEINSTTDNPIVDASRGQAGSLSGGNFQGTSLAVAMDRIRIGLQHIGRIAYAQMVELGSPSMSRGLPPDIAASEPSFDYGQKALDMATASYLAELSFVANTVTNHVEPAEMHNQSVNSLALVSGRYAATAVQLTQMILANLLLSLCQALDLRAMHIDFLVILDAIMRESVSKVFSPALPQTSAEELILLLATQARIYFRETSTLDTPDRFKAMSKPLIADVFTYISTPHPDSKRISETHKFDAVTFHSSLASTLSEAWLFNRQQYFDKGSAASHLGIGTKKLYQWIRRDLGLSMRKGIDDDMENMDIHVSRIYEGIVRGHADQVLISLFDISSTMSSE